MSDNLRKRRSSFFHKPEESFEKQLELFNHNHWLDEEKEKIISNSALFGGLGKKTLLEYADKLKCIKKEYPKLVSNKQEEQILLKEKIRKNKIELDWETVYNGLTDFERNFVKNRPDFKCLVEKVELLTFHMSLVKRSNYQLHTILNKFNRHANEEINKLQEYLVDKIIDDSGVGTSYNDSRTNSLVVESSEEDCVEMN